MTKPQNNWIDAKEPGEAAICGTARLGAAIALTACLFFLCLGLGGCSGLERHQYVFWGDIVMEHPKTLQDHWTDCGPFLPDDRSMKMRRGKAGVLRFYKKNNFEKSIPVDGELVVYVFNGIETGIELTEPEYKLIINSEQLNRQRKFDKKNGYTYHIWLDLGEVDLPPEPIAILVVFTETKTREQVASGITYTQIGGEGTSAKELEPGSSMSKALKNAASDSTRSDGAKKPGRKKSKARRPSRSVEPGDLDDPDDGTDTPGEDGDEDDLNLPDYDSLQNGESQKPRTRRDTGGTDKDVDELDRLDEPARFDLAESAGTEMSRVLTLDLSDSQASRLSSAPMVADEDSKTLHKPVKTAYARDDRLEQYSGAEPAFLGSPNESSASDAEADSPYLHAKKLTFDDVRTIGSPAMGTQSYFARGILDQRTGNPVVAPSGQGTAANPALSGPNLMDATSVSAASGSSQGRAIVTNQ